MGFSKIFDIISVATSWFTPEKVKGRARGKLEKLKGKESALLKKEPTLANVKRLTAVRKSISRLQHSFKND